ncbi:XTP/dITP diphosphatase [Ornithinibacillus halotolerans]|uniref:dITP/XTP pyrophosphatase n=1 Tax=Ornithinibacillus halotolerans TaxID=1274357 RepID=A0A916S652_9BACI|nr:XTP/dITP diphosphatase [Ornithinibacillus halotolerans]GGA86098.1 non-canonical purine NTP pyrophosphatase [Ornithinibacillus halotolerans]
MKELLIATKNKGKAEEFKVFFERYGIIAKSLLDLQEDLPDIEETGETFEENAALKSEGIAKILNIPVLADDSGLVIDALGGKPGIYSARYAGEPKDDKKNIEKVLRELGDLPVEKRTARFVCVLSLSIPGNSTIYKKGTCEGVIGFEEKGIHGFGYDPIFIPEGYNQTLAELGPDEKNKISHRANAIKQLEEWIQNQQ